MTGWHGTYKASQLSDGLVMPHGLHSGNIQYLVLETMYFHDMP